MFGKEKIMTIKHEILKENYEILKKDYDSLEERIKHSEEAYEIIKFHLQNNAKELEEECKRERSEKDKYKMMLEVKNTKESETVDELQKKDTELLLTKRELKKMEYKYLQLAEKLRVVEVECTYFKSRRDIEAVMSEVGENEVNKDVNNNKATTDVIMISDENDDKPPRESNIIPHQSGDRNQEQCRNRVNSILKNRASTITPKRRLFVPLPPISSSSSSTTDTSSDSSSVNFIRG